MIQKNEFDTQLKTIEIEKLDAILSAQEAERAKIARNLHDDVGAILSMSQRNLEHTFKVIPKQVNYYKDIQFTIEMLNHSIDKLRSISQSLLPHYLLKFGLIKTLQRLFEQTQRSMDNDCQFSTNLSEDLPIGEKQKINFYYIISELVNNLMKHGHPQKVIASLDYLDHSLFFKVQHDGIAISQSDYEHLLKLNDGVGLESITNRLQLISGQLVYKRNLNGGEIELSMPFNNNI